MPVLVIALTSDTMPLHAITEFAATALIPKLSQVDGVGEVSIAGRPGARRAPAGQPAAARRSRLVARGCSQGHRRHHRRPCRKGQIEGPRNAFQVGANDQLFDAAAYRDAIIAYRNGAPVKFKDIGETVDGLENDQIAAWYNGKPALILNVKRQPGPTSSRSPTRSKLCCRRSAEIRAART